jgi:hypothetical protein
MPAVRCWAQAENEALAQLLLQMAANKDEAEKRMAEVRGTYRPSTPEGACGRGRLARPQSLAWLGLFCLEQGGAARRVPALHQGELGGDAWSGRKALLGFGLP